ncbi:hypothetical protein P171DRAFT_503564 [Karstenula rhodostoma CBS 690.94]|uniref:Aminoglycoside phosphotransferase domain-containing protein n=1 Tax=Karstenula rhodostoma CBS 690.94 TaxID=1392251 RepID=A0A9P4UIZ7_9PLEO|nr:hypothetical protein P171DRAFT_503564 [Karstenula rhodostoma CBS 690.94]
MTAFDLLPGKAVDIKGSDTSNSTSTTSNDKRQDFNAMRAIPEQNYKTCLVAIQSLQNRRGDPITAEDCKVLGKTEGAYHVVVSIGVTRKGNLERYIFRVPANGTAALWRQEDRYMMEREVELLRQIRRNTDIPVPNVIAYNTELLNTLGAPWMLTDMLPGNSAYRIWFDAPSEEPNYYRADVPSPETHRKRVTFLKSLAGHMVKLLPLEFDCIGIPEIRFTHNIQDVDACKSYKAIMGPSYHWNSMTDAFEVEMRGPFEATQDYLGYGLRDWCDQDDLQDDDPGYNDPNEDPVMLMGVYKLLQIIFNCTVFNPDRDPEKFLIHHNDLDLQNILTDKDGVVTGIIDWDGAYAGPRCIGPTATPKFLLRDWFPHECGKNLERAPFMGFMTKHYRNIYAAAVYLAGKEQGIDDIATRYTTKSALYQAIFAAIYEGGHPLDITNKVLRSIPGFRMQPSHFKKLLGKGWPAAVEYLEREIPKIFEAELPDEKFMCEVAAISAVKPPLKRGSISAVMEDFHVTQKRTKTVDVPFKVVQNFVQSLVENDMVTLNLGGLFSSPVADERPILSTPPNTRRKEKQKYRFTLEMSEKTLEPVSFGMFTH